MLEINKLEDVRGNNIIIYSIRTLLNKGSFPHFVILSGHMGVGKSTVARLVAEELTKSEFGVKTYNLGMQIDMSAIDNDVFKMNPSKPQAFVFEELQGLSKADQTSLLAMLDRQPDNVYIICTTTESYKILRTIKSRATTWDFKLLSEKQLSQLLDDYLETLAVELNQDAKIALLKSSYGIPRDLLKNTDLAISGEFSGDQLNELLGRVSEDLFFSILCSLKNSSVDFASVTHNLMDEVNRDKLAQFRDFFTRYLLERKGLDNLTISSEKISTLDSMYSEEELGKIGRMLVKATSDTFILELSLLNMELVKSSTKSIVGQQVDRLASNQAIRSEQKIRPDASNKQDTAKISRESIRHIMFGNDSKG